MDRTIRYAINNFWGCAVLAVCLCGITARAEYNNHEAKISDEENEIRMYTYGLIRAPELITPFTREFPAYKFYRPKIRPGIEYSLDPLAGGAEVLFQEGYLTYQSQKKKLEKIYPDGKYDNMLIGYRPMLILVHPDCPVTSLSMEQLRRIARYDQNHWKENGWDCGHDIVKRSCHGIGNDIRNGLFDGEFYNRVGILKFNPRGHTMAELTAAAKIRSKLRKGCRDATKMFKDALEDPYGIIFCAATPAAYQSGLKIIAICDEKGEEFLPIPKNVISGKYPARVPFRCWFSPCASDKARFFAKWYTGEKAADFLAGKGIYTPAYVEVLKHKATRNQQLKYRYPAEGLGWDKSIRCAITVMPVVLDNQYYLRADMGVMQKTAANIEEYLQKQKNVKLVDRKMLDEILNERAIAGSEGEIISVDIFIQPILTLVDNTLVLKILAYHGPTASVLAERSLPVDSIGQEQNQNELLSEFDKWYPAILSQLSRVRRQKIWSLTAMLPYQTQNEAADDFTRKLQESLQKEKSFFLAGYSLFMPAHQELWMNILGVGKSVSGNFVPTADWIIQGRFRFENMLQMRIVSGVDFSPVASKSFAGKPEEFLPKVRQWIISQAEILNKKSGVTKSAKVEDFAKLDWAKLQAQEELKIFDQIYDQLKKKKLPKYSNTVFDTRILPDIPVEQKRLRQMCYRVAMRACFLDPTNVKAAQARIKAVKLFKHWEDFAYCQAKADAYEYYALNFTNTRDHRAAIEYAITYISEEIRILQSGNTYYGYNQIANLKGSLDRKSIIKKEFKRVLKLYRFYIDMYVDCWYDRSMGKGAWKHYCIPDEYIFKLATYFRFFSDSDTELRETCDYWRKTFGKYPQLFPSEDFLYLRILAYRDKKEEFLKKLNAMIIEHPDPKSKYWEHGMCKDRVQEEMYNLFRDNETSRCNFHRWCNGKGLGQGLPYDGYNPKKQEPRKELPWHFKKL